MRLRLQDIAAATQGTLLAESDDAADVVAAGITWDSRQVKPGDVYLALPGERVDGHEFIAAAAEAGAVCAIVSEEYAEDAQSPCGRADICPDLPLIAVPDTAAAFTQLARAWRTQLQGVVVGLTGSTGKTTTKGLVRDVLAAAGSVVATKANQNNELGVPNTLLAADADTNAVVVEMGMRGMGQIAALCQVAYPQWGLITNVGESHMELLGTRDNIGRAKAELFAALPDSSGIAFVNAADDYADQVCEWADLQARGVHHVYFDGRDRAADPEMARLAQERCQGCPTVWAEHIVFDAQGCPTFTLHADRFEGCGFAPAMQCTCTLQLGGLHNVSNACSAAAVGLAAGLTLQQCADVLAASAPEKGRQQFLRTPQGTLVVNDAYNANPDSMRASLATFAALDLPEGGRRIAVLGDMGELGHLAPEAHERVGAYAAAAGLDLLVCVGELARRIAQGARSAGMCAGLVVESDTLDEALSQVQDNLTSADAVLVKASHFMEFERLVERLVS